MSDTTTAAAPAPAGTIPGAPPVAFDAAGRLSVTFGRFDPPAYALFLRCKRLPEYEVARDPATEAYTISAPARFAVLLGAAAPATPAAPLPLADYLFDDQRAIVGLALRAKRFASWQDTGMGKTAVGLEFARQVSGGERGRVLVVTLNNLIDQTLEMAGGFYPGEALPIVRLPGRAAMREWCATGRVGGAETRCRVGIVNYEKFNPDKGALGKATAVPECKHLAGVWADETSRLAMSGGKQKWALIHSMRGVPYKLSTTATPAPNNTMEFASQASFLETMRAGSVEQAEQQIIWSYFTRDPKTHRWTVRKHARRAFFEWMASWSICVRDPRRYGWRLGMADVPPPDIIKHAIRPTPEQLALAATLTEDGRTGQMGLFADARDTNVMQRVRLSQLAKGFLYRKTAGGGRVAVPVPSRKPAAVADLVAGEAADGTGRGLQTLVWTVFDAETEILSRLLAGAPFAVEVLTGSTPKERRGPILERFRRGETRVLLARASMLGFGLNFQFCRSMIFSGWSDSYVAWYQAVRRAYRCGQQYRLRVHVPVVPELEGHMLENIEAKGGRHEAEAREQEEAYIAAFGRLGGLS